MSVVNNASALQWWSQHLGKVTSISRSPGFVSGVYHSPLRLKGFGENPILFLLSTAFPLDAVSQFSRLPSSFVKIVICPDEKNQEQVESLRLGRSLVISPTDVRELTKSSHPLESFGSLVRERFPWPSLIPFTTSTPAFGNMFHGRTTELKELIYVDSQDYAICGHGGMGKSSLLAQMVQRLRLELSPRYERIVQVDLIDCPSNLDEAANRIAKSVCPSAKSENVGVHDLLPFLRYCRHSIPQFQAGPIELIIDEMDRILHVDSLCRDKEGYAYPLMRILRNARHARPQELIRLTICGREGTRNLLSSQENPFAVAPADGKPNTRFRLIELKPFDNATSTSLVRDALCALGCLNSFSKGLLEKRIEECKGNPFQLQSLGLDLCRGVMNVFG